MKIKKCRMKRKDHRNHPKNVEIQKALLEQRSRLNSVLQDEKLCDSDLEKQLSIPGFFFDREKNRYFRMESKKSTQQNTCKRNDYDEGDYVIDDDNNHKNILQKLLRMQIHGDVNLRQLASFTNLKVHPFTLNSDQWIDCTYHPLFGLVYATKLRDIYFISLENIASNVDNYSTQITTIAGDISLIQWDIDRNHKQEKSKQLIARLIVISNKDDIQSKRVEIKFSRKRKYESSANNMNSSSIFDKYHPPQYEIIREVDDYCIDCVLSNPDYLYTYNSYKGVIRSNKRVITQSGVVKSMITIKYKNKNEHYVNSVDDKVNNSRISSRKTRTSNNSSTNDNLKDAYNDRLPINAAATNKISHDSQMSTCYPSMTITRQSPSSSSSSSIYSTTTNTSTTTTTMTTQSTPWSSESVSEYNNLLIGLRNGEVRCLDSRLLSQSSSIGTIKDHIQIAQFPTSIDHMKQLSWNEYNFLICDIIGNMSIYDIRRPMMTVLPITITPLSSNYDIYQRRFYTPNLFYGREEVVIYPHPSIIQQGIGVYSLSQATTLLHTIPYPTLLSESESKCENKLQQQSTIRVKLSTYYDDYCNYHPIQLFDEINHNKNSHEICCIPVNLYKSIYKSQNMWDGLYAMVNVTRKPITVPYRSYSEKDEKQSNYVFKISA